MTKSPSTAMVHGMIFHADEARMKFPSIASVWKNILSRQGDDIVPEHIK
jgi:hypothetical protein